MRAHYRLTATLVVMACLVVAAPVRAADDPLNALLNKAHAHTKATEWHLAIPLYEQAMLQAARRYGKDHDITINCLFLVGWANFRGGNIDKAQPMLEHVVKAREKKLGSNHIQLAGPLMLLGCIHRNRGEYKRGERQARRSLTIRQAQLPADSTDVAASQFVLGTVYFKAGELAKAEPLYLRALATRRAKLAKNAIEIAESLDDLGDLYKMQGQLPKALSILQESMRIKIANYGKEHPIVATSLVRIAQVQSSLGQYASAAGLLKRAVAIHEKATVKNKHEYSMSYNNLAHIQVHLRQFAEAEQNYRHSLTILQEIYPADHPLIAGTLHEMGWLFQRKGEMNKAEPLYQRAVEMYEKKMGRDHITVANVLFNLADLHRMQRDYTRSVSEHKRVMEIRLTKLGPNHPATMSIFTYLGLLAGEMGGSEPAGRFYDRARRAYSQYTARILPGLPDRDQATFLLNTDDATSFHAGLSLALANRDNQTLAAQSASWLINGKGTAHEALASAALRVRDSSNPALAKANKELEALRKELARLTHAEPKPGEEKELQKKRDRLTEQEQVLASTIRRLGGVTPAPWVELDAARQAMPNGAVFVDIARMYFYDYKLHRWTGERYGAWITPKVGDVKVVDLGPAFAVDALVNRLRKELEAAPTLITEKGELEAEKVLLPHLQALSQKVLHPLTEHLGGNTRILLCPDANLWLVPWDALTLPDGRYAIEQYRISYLVSGRSAFHEEAKVNRQVGPALVLANPDYDLGRSRKAPSALRMGRARPLPGTAREAQAAAPSLFKWTGQKPVVLTGRQATAAAVKEVHSPRALLLCTHGFFRADQERAPGAPNGNTTKKWENPLLKSGLLFAGCNVAQQKANDNGILTALEAVGLELRGTELVVLSACQTGLGEVRNGEGVAGLRQAFLLAGARAVVSTLWQVDDEATALLMARFFDNLAKGKSRASAMRDAQLRLIHERRAGAGGTAHPFFWAALTLTGR
jgi:CHAT domain-containing protein